MLRIINLWGVDRPVVDIYDVNPQQLSCNDGLSYYEWLNWFRGYDLSQPLAIIHFTFFRY